ncbi:outer membrane lipoprotein LolB [Kineobactrum sediminis]|uniref:Outer-membrane lipoprotein LolB n=1 Tax=Kineobactrum sediminis TaxID=1905677 RepID=A0A2N5Y3D3_9GAMM|nr:lipoprotein insertase outer membrane protein LolB [Kineobactrum sediminis]PLW82888.1 outer membrane lipoprotein LolB [Kineobactrum sediminis]
MLRVGILCLLLGLGACAGRPVVESAGQAWQQHSADMAALQNWDADGKLALRRDDQAETANLAWQQRGRQTVLQLSGPLGLQATEIRSDGSQLRVQHDGAVERFDISGPETLQAQTGWDLPLQALPYWLKGIPAPHSPATGLTLRDNLLYELQQDGWLVHYDRYGQFGTHILPTRLSIERRETRVRVVIQRWQPGVG